MKDIKITEDCQVQGKHVAAGKTLTGIDNTVAAEIVASGRGHIISAKRGTRDASGEAPGVETRDPAPETRDPDPKPPEKNGEGSGDETKPPAKKQAKQ